LHNVLRDDDGGRRIGKDREEGKRGRERERKRSRQFAPRKKGDSFLLHYYSHLLLPWQEEEDEKIRCPRGEGASQNHHLPLPLSPSLSLSGGRR